VTTSPPTTDQLHSILEYISPVSGTGGQGQKAVYGVGELVKGAKDAEDAVKKFKEDQERFVRPVVCICLFLGGLVGGYGYGLLMGFFGGRLLIG
jgi:hypothetical protein